MINPIVLASQSSPAVRFGAGIPLIIVGLISLRYYDHLAALSALGRRMPLGKAFDFHTPPASFDKGVAVVVALALVTLGIWVLAQ
jgi:hypothetical protein